MKDKLGHTKLSRSNMKGIKKEKTLLRENLKKFEEGVDYTVSSEFDD